MGLGLVDDAEATLALALEGEAGVGLSSFDFRDTNMHLKAYVHPLMAILTMAILTMAILTNLQPLEEWREEYIL